MKARSIDKEENRHNNLINFIINEKIHLLLGALVVTLFWAALLQNKIDMLSLVVIICSYFSVMQINRYTDIEEDRINIPDALHSALKNRSIILFLIMLSFAVSLVLALVGGIQSLIYLLLMYLLGICYSFNIRFKKTKIMRVKQIFLLKNIIPTLVWAFAVIIYPIVFSRLRIDFGDLLIFFYVLSIIFIADVSLDIKDVKGDLAAGVPTLPVKYGILATKKILKSVNLISGIVILSLLLIPYSNKFPSLHSYLSYFFIALWIAGSILFMSYYINNINKSKLFGADILFLISPFVYIIGYFWFKLYLILMMKIYLILKVLFFMAKRQI